MITNKTVFVLGAGASIPYGLPSGYKLLERVCESMSVIGAKQSDLVCQVSRIDTITAKKFRDDLLHSGRYSVDAFLEYRPEYLEVGRTAIAAELIKDETIDKLMSLENDDNWYKYILNEIVSDFDDFGNNEISFITYNYDRSLEYYFYFFLTRSFGKSKDDVAKMLNKIDIVHVHGMLGDLPWEGGKYREYTNELNHKNLETAKDGIKIIHEQNDEAKQFKKARELLSKARYICFLGFGHNKKNLDRLDLSKTPHDVVFIGTLNGKGQAEKDRISSTFRSYNKKLHQHESDKKSLEFLKTSPHVINIF